MTRLSFAVIVSAVFCTTVIGLSGRAYAANECPTTDPAYRPSYFAGSSGNRSVSVWGARASIEYRNPDLCGDDSATSNGTSVVWSMVTAHSSALPNNVNADMWAQSGYGQFGPYDGFGTGITLFDQWTFPCKATLTCAGQVASTGFIGGAVEGTNYAYTSKWVPSASTIHIYLHGDEFDELNYDPTGVWASAWQAQFFGETKETQSDVVGTQGDSANLTNLSKSDQTGTFSYLASNNASITENTRYHANAYAINDAPAVAVWTSPLH